VSGEWTELFGRDHWKAVKGRIADQAPTVRKRLGRIAEAWWDEYEDELSEYGKHELIEILEILRDQGTPEAKLYIALRMDREEWAKYRDGVTDQLRGIAIRRARILEALEDLGRRAAKIIGRAAGAALGL